MSLSRRTLAAGLATAAFLRSEFAAARAATEPSQPLTGPISIAMLLYPGMTALDVVGPQNLLAGLADGGVSLVAERIGPVASDTGLALIATHDFNTCPRDVTVVFVPGGDGTPTQMRHDATLAFVADRARRASWITSVCTGSLILGSAGLLKGYRATSHWSVRDRVLPLLGAEPVASRVVIDRDRITAAGISAGLDFALALAATLRGEAYARTAQLVAEYAPQPPFHAGTPLDAGSEITAAADAILADLVSGSLAAAQAR